jgi:hypothetical protein
MAIYATFFLSEPKQLPGGFPGWRLPLPKPVRRQFTNPFTGELSTIETRHPEWPDEQDDEFKREYRAVLIDGRYEDYLEGRLSSFVRNNPHWAAKGLTEVELGPLAEALDFEAKFECPLYAPPSSGATLLELPLKIIPKLASLDQQGLFEVAERWALTMSTPDYTHSITGENDGWAANEAMEILQPITDLARKATPDHRMYILIEA